MMIFRKFKMRINRIKLAIALALMCSVLGFSAMAQDNPKAPLDEEGVVELIEELKNGLPDLIDDESQVTAITEKWDAREDLAGKTKAQILNLLFADVKAVVADEEITKKIWDGWNADGKKEEPIETPKPEPTPVETPKPQPKPVETPKPNNWLKISHEGGYIGHFYVSWDEPNKPNNLWKAEGKTPRLQETINIPANATNIRLKIENDTGLVWQPRFEIINKVLQSSELNKCYRIYGTTLAGRWDNNCQ